MKGWTFITLHGLVFLVPEQSKWGLALPLFTISAVAAFITIARAIRSGLKGAGFWNVVKGSVPSLFAYIGLIVIVVLMLQSYMQSLIWLLPVVIVLLAVAVRNAWGLLVAVHK